MSLRLIAHRLINDNAALKKDLDDLQAFLDKSISDAAASAPNPAQVQQARKIIDGAIDQMREMVLENSDSGDEILKRLEMAIANPQLAVDDQQPGMAGIAVPDLVSLVGVEKTTAFLRKALASEAIISSVKGEDTTKLARSIALQMLTSMKKPQWNLARSLDSAALFEGMQKRFPKSANSNADGYDSARLYYMLGLIASHRTKEAVALAKHVGSNENVPNDAIEALERAGFTTELADFFHDLLAENPALPYWDDYLDVAVRAGEQKKMLALMEAAAAHPGLSENERIRFEGSLGHAYLAVDRVDDGVAALRKQIANAAKAAPDASGRSDYDLGQLGLDLAKLGGVLGRKDLEDEGIQAATDALHKAQAYVPHQDAANPFGQSNPAQVPSVSNIRPNEITTTLEELGRPAQAEAMLKDALINLPPGGENEARVFLVELMGIYDRAGRPADVLAILDRAPCWSAKDLSDVLTQEVTVDRNPDYAGYFAADALAATGHNAEARKILDALLNVESGYDPAYELLLKIAPRDEALARLDALFALDKFEPRPLIWKAKLLLDAGKLDEAETVARQAVAIDPSDGEHGPGRRMRVYSVLADILQARGDKTGAENYRGAVTAIRHSEDADKFYEAGLITRAVAMYNEALTHFADAYCIQSRLALRMAELGDMEGAEKHYRRAYELMPDSFGRVESHCFGCERAFAGYYAQSIAEQVFTNLAKTRPDKPQVHYLLAYLRKEQDNPRGALPELREAVKLDPEYLNAWKMIEEISDDVLLPAAERDTVKINLIRLDPLARHTDANPGDMVDLAAGWNAQAAAAKLQPPAPGPLYPLKASADAAPANAAAGQLVPGAQDYRRRDPTGVVTGNKFIQGAASIYSGYAALNFGQ